MKKLITFSLFLFLFSQSIFSQTFTFGKYFVAYGTGINATANQISGGVDGSFCEEVSVNGVSQSNGQGRHVIDVEFRLTSSAAVQVGDSISFYMKLGTFLSVLPGGMLYVTLLDVNGNQVGNLQINLDPLSSITWKRYSINIPTGTTSIIGVSFIIVSSQTTVSFFANTQLDFDKIESWRAGTAQLLTSFENNITGVENTELVPTAFKLEQNYPNPFNPTTTIKFHIPSAGHVSLKVYDINGKEIATLTDQYVPAGNSLVEIDASNLASGIYFYRLQAGSFTATKKMILMK